MTRPHIVVIGSSNTDFVVRAANIPSPGETVLGSSFFEAAGGKGANQAVAAARLGAAVTFVGRVGADQLGDRAMAGLQDEGIDTGLVVRDPDEASGVALIVVSDDGENAIAVAPGANSQLLPSDVDAASESIAAADVMLLQLETPMRTVSHAVRVAADAGTPVVLNPAPAAEIDAETLREISVLTPNGGEALKLAGLSGSGLDAWREAARRLRSTGVRRVVITMGSAGVLAVESDGETRIPGRKMEVVDTTAAGDSFNGALAVALAEGAALPEAAVFANRAAALATTKPGTQPSLPTREEVEALG
jgi:ribokinase